MYNSFNLNTYGYCYQNPVLLIDPNGKQTEFWDTQEPTMAEYIVSSTVGFIGDARAGVMNLASRILGEESRYRGDGGIGVVKLPEGSTTSIVEDILDATVGIVTARFGVSGGVLAQEVKGGVNEGKNIVKDISKTSREARRDVMRKEGIPTSQQPVSQSKNSAGREYTYEVSKSYGGVQKKSVQQQTMDRSHPGEKHWEGGYVKLDSRTGEIRMNNYGRPKLDSNKSKVDY